MENRRLFRKSTALLLCAALVFSVLWIRPAYAETEQPDIASEGAVLYNATTGKFLYGKNADKAYYPASITKILTALLTLENCSQDDTVTFSESATTNLEYGAVTLGLTDGDQVSVHDCLYGLLLKSANEVANGLAEHISGSVSAFAELMNRKAKALGCTGSHFANPNGLDDANHYTTPHDMALIARACFENSDFRTVEATLDYTFPATKNRPNGTYIVMGHKMVNPGNSQYYEGILGGKTGYTSASGNTLVTCAERNGVRLIAVVMKSRSTHYADTKALLDYGFAVSGTGTASSSGTVTSVTGAPGASAEPGTKATSASSGQETSGATGTTAAGSSSGSGGPGATETPAAGWHQDSTGWFYVKDGGSRAKAERLTIAGFEYWFDGTGYMATGWRADQSGAWYYLRPSFGGMKKAAWVETGGKWYYLGQDGRMLTNTTTPDGYRVNEQGEWIG